MPLPTHLGRRRQRRGDRHGILPFLWCAESCLDWAMYPPSARRGSTGYAALIPGIGRDRIKPLVSASELLSIQLSYRKSACTLRSATVKECLRARRRVRRIFAAPDWRRTWVKTRRKRRNTAGILSKLWLPAIILVVLVVVGYGVNSVRHVSDAISYPPSTSSIPATVVQINPKNVTYEVFGDLGGGGRVVYANLDSQPIAVTLTSLPWSHSM